MKTKTFTLSLAFLASLSLLAACAPRVQSPAQQPAQQQSTQQQSTQQQSSSSAATSASQPQASASQDAPVAQPTNIDGTYKGQDASILADAMEAMFAAVSFDADFAEAENERDGRQKTASVLSLGIKFGRGIVGSCHQNHTFAHERLVLICCLVGFLDDFVLFLLLRE